MSVGDEREEVADEARGEEGEETRGLHPSPPRLGGQGGPDVGIGKGLVLVDCLHDEVNRCDVCHVRGLGGPATAGDHTSNSSQAINYDRAGISFGEKNARLIIQGDDHTLLRYGNSILVEILASVGDEGRRPAHSHIHTPTPLQDGDTGTAVLVQHLWLLHFLLWDGTPEFGKAVSRVGEVARVPWGGLHLVGELDGRVLGSEVDEVSGKVVGFDLLGVNLDDSDV